MIVAYLGPIVFMLITMAYYARRRSPYIAQTLLGIVAILLGIQLCWLASAALS